MSVMEMSHRSKAFDNIIKEAEAGSERADEHSGQLQGIVPAGRSIPAVCHDPDEPDEEQKSRLYRNRSVGKESLSGSTDLRRGESSLLPPKTRHFLTFRTAPICRYSGRCSIMCISVRTIPFTVHKYKKLPNTKGQTLVADVSSCFLVRAGGCNKIRCDLRRRTEEYRTGRCCYRDHPRRSDHRRCPAGHTNHA